MAKPACGLGEACDRCITFSIGPELRCRPVGGLGCRRGAFQEFPRCAEPPDQLADSEQRS